MFQAQATPYATFAYHEIGQGLPSYTYQQTQLASEPVAGTGTGATNLGGSGNLGLGAAGPTAVTGGSAGPSTLIFTSPAFNPSPEHGAFSSFHSNNSNSNSNINNNRTSPPHRPVKMAQQLDANLAGDVAAQEAAAKEYQPYLEGPLVGDKLPSHIITQEYAKADPVYVQKTLALPQTYSHYRPIQGDGNCGWRAIAFSYFEALIRSGDTALVHTERIRLAQYGIIGHVEFVYEDMREELEILMNDIYTCMQNQQDAMPVLVEKFNDPAVANHILYFIRLLASSWLKADPTANELAGFIPEGIGIQGYCREYIEACGREIEHLGINVLANVLLKPAGIVLEIAYLDRSPGPEVNTYRIPAEATGRDPTTLGPIIYLLFRPDHYDILYRDAPAPIAPLNIQVNRVSFPPRHENASNLHNFTSNDISSLALIPGLQGISPSLPLLTVPATSPLDPYMHSPNSPWLAPPLPYVNPLATQKPAPPPPPPAAVILPLPTRRQTPPLRFSEYCHPSFVESDTWRETCFTTNTFKNSHFNTAHYNNPNFQPEEYKPGGGGGVEEIPEQPLPRHNGRKRGST